MIRTAFPANIHAVVSLMLAALLFALSGEPVAAQRPNIIFAISDDQSFPHTSAYGDPVVRTPTFDRIAREGVLFTYAFVAAPSCTPSRGAILTGQDVWRLEEGGNLWSALPAEIATYPDLLEQTGYVVGLERKGWGPGKNEGPALTRKRNPAGPAFESFEAFLAERPDGKPFVYWFGTSDPHRPYDEGSGVAAGKDPAAVQVPPFFPDVPEVRSDMLDYYQEIERFDRELGDVLARVEALGELNNSVVIVTSDNGMPFPRCKATLYDCGTRVPLAIMWPEAIPGGRTVSDFVNLRDIAPTILDAVGLLIPEEMTGRGLLPVLRSPGEGRVEAERDFVVTARERHAWVRRDGTGYPARAIRTDGFLYIWNAEPDRWPAGDPDPQYSFSGWTQGPGGTHEGYGDVDSSPTKRYLIEHRREYPELFQLSFGKHPGEELYVLTDDPNQIRNVAEEPRFASIKEELRERLRTYLLENGDPRVTGGTIAFDLYPYYGRKSPHAEGVHP